MSQPPWKAELTLDFTVAQDQNKGAKMLCNGAELHFVPTTPRSPDSGYGAAPNSPHTHRLKAACRPPNLPLPDLPQRWVNHYGLAKHRGNGHGHHAVGNKFLFNCNNGGIVEDFHHQQHHQSMEQSICQVYASVMLYDDARRQWLPSGGVPGMARVHIYHHQSNNTCRVVGRLMTDQSVVINCAIVKGLKYNQATATFHQWRDSRQVYGLNFQSADDAEKFARSMMESLDGLQQIAAPPARPPQQPQAPVAVDHHRNGPAEDHRLRHEIHNSQPSQTPVISRHVPEAPAAPAAPAAPPAPPPAPPAPPSQPAPQPAPSPSSAPPPPGAPPAPPGPPPPPSGGGPPPPPPPPPPPGSGNSGGGGGGGGTDLAKQLAAATLKKAPKEESENRRPGGPGGMNMMEDLQKKLLQRKNKSNASGEPKTAPSTASKQKVSPPSPPGQHKDPKAARPWQKTTTTSSSRFNGSTAPGSPKTNRRGSVNQNGNADNIDFDRMKQEIMTEMRKEIGKMKEEIIEAIKMELNRR